MNSIYECYYDFEALNEFAIHQADKQNMTLDEYVTNEKQRYLDWNNEILAEMAESNDVERITELVEDLNEARVNLSDFSIYDYERGLKPEERR